MGSRVWPFWVTWRHCSRNHSTLGGRLCMGGHYGPPIVHRCGGSPRTSASKRSTPFSLKDVILPILACKPYIVWKRLQIGTDMLLIIISTGDRLFRFINIDDLEWLWIPQKGVLVNFSQFLAAAHISAVNCNEMVGDRPRQPAYEI